MLNTQFFFPGFDTPGRTKRPVPILFPAIRGKNANSVKSWENVRDAGIYPAIAVPMDSLIQSGFVIVHEHITQAPYA